MLLEGRGALFLTMGMEAANPAAQGGKGFTCLPVHAGHVCMWPGMEGSTGSSRMSTDTTGSLVPLP